MDCQDVRLSLLDYQRGLLVPELHREVRAHLERCAACAHEDAAEHVLTEVLDRRLPQHPAPLALKRRLAAHWPAPTVAKRPWWARWRRTLVPALAAAVLLAVVVPLARERAAVDSAAGVGGMVAEAVNDHLRILQRERPLDIESGGIHQVKPWFAGRVDFAPVVSFDGDQEFPLQGGAVGYFIDRKAAVFVYKRRLHSISLFVFRADGLPWPERGLVPAGVAETYRAKLRGFNVILWRAGDLGYALVSDVDARDLSELATRLARG